MMSEITLIDKFPKAIQELLKQQLSKDALKRKIQDLSPKEKEELEKIKKELGIKTDEEIINFLLSGIKEVVIPDDRKLLSKPLMEKITKLEKIAYVSQLREFKEKCENTSDDLYSIILETLKNLWVNKYGKEEPFRRFEIYKEFEKVLFKDPRYRDHFIHQFQVFLSGLPIIDKFYDSINQSYENIFGRRINVEFTWLLSATFHDVGYLVQQFDKWLNSFFKEFLEISDLPINLDLSKLLLTRNFQEYIGKLSSLYSTIYSDDIHNSKKSWRYNGMHYIDYNFNKLIMSKLLEKRNHGIISSLILLDRIENSKIVQQSPSYIENTFSSEVMPAALSIALHDKDIFLDNNLKKIEFDKDPLSFLLIFCDAIQEWGRPINYSSADSIEDMPILNEYIISDDKISVTLTYNTIKEITLYDGTRKTTYELKEEEINNLFRKIKSNNPVFEITLKSIDKDYDYPERSYKSTTL